MINPEPQILNLPANPDPRPGQKPPGSEHRSRGKIGRLPKKIRDQLNQMIQDGVPYATIKQNLGDHGQQLTVDNISEWKTHGRYKEWCNEQLWREEIGARIEVFTDLLEDTDPTALSLVGLKLSLGQLCEQLRELGPGSRKEQFENDAAHYLRMVNSVARLAKSSLALQQHRNDAAKSQAAELKQLDQDRDLSDKEYELLVNNMDRVFKVRRRPPPAAPSPRSASVPNPSIQQSPNPEKPPSKILPRRKAETSKFTNADSERRQSSQIENGKQQGPEGSAPSESPPPEIKNAERTSPSLPLEERVGERRSSERVPEIRNQKSEIENAPPPEPCHFCHTDLPALLPDGERPFANCKSCGITLHSPHNRHLYCPACASDLRMIIVNGQRILSSCPYCEAALPPWSPPTG